MTEPLSEKVEERLQTMAAKLDGEIGKHIARVRCDAAYPARSFVGEIFHALIDAHKLANGVGKHHENRRKRTSR